MLVTFTRLATGELRDRVRQRLASAAPRWTRALAARSLGAAAPDARPTASMALLADGTRAEVEQRRDRLAVALADFDAATITTTHGFCQEVLGGLGVAGDVDRGHRFSEDARDLVDDVVDDLYVSRFHDDAPPSLDRDEAREVVRGGDRQPDRAAGADRRTRPTARSARATTWRPPRATELDRRKRALALMTYDDLVTRLRATLEGPAAPAVAARAARALPASRWSTSSRTPTRTSGRSCAPRSRIRDRRSC